MSEFFDYSVIFRDTDEILHGKERVKINDALGGKDVVGLYFSAHWCPPCRGFTPVLASMYNDLKVNNKSIEIVFVSSDSSEDQFLEYYEEMPWLALPYSNRDLKATLSDQYDCGGIPYLVLLDGKTGAEITRDGREAIMEGGVSGFPFDSESISKAKTAKKQKILSFFCDWKVFGDNVIGSELVGKEAVAVVFGNANSQTPWVSTKLAQSYETLSDRMAVIYVSHDVADEDKEAEFQSTMPSSWMKIKSSEQILATSGGIFGTLEVPVVYVMSGNCAELFSDDASRDIYYQQAAGFPWSKEAIEAAEKAKEERIAAFKEKMNAPGMGFLEEAKLVTRDSDNALSEVGGSAAAHLSNFELVGLYFSGH